VRLEAEPSGEASEISLVPGPLAIRGRFGGMRHASGMSDAPGDQPIVVVGFTETGVTPLIRKWWLILLLGLALIVIGVLLLVNTDAAAFTLALLIAFGLFLAGIDSIVEAQRHRVRWPSYLMAVIWIAVGVIAVAWPGVTLWALAVTVGLGLIIGGLAEALLAVRMHRALPSWGLWLLAGVLSTVAGVLCILWPDATVLVLAVLLGLWVIIRGVVTTLFALALRQIRHVTSPTVPT
jgi:uncharacterized membrane protein HdeD (DUF308 family)